MSSSTVITLLKHHLFSRLHDERYTDTFWPLSLLFLHIFGIVCNRCRSLLLDHVTCESCRRGGIARPTLPEANEEFVICIPRDKYVLSRH